VSVGVSKITDFGPYRKSTANANANEDATIELRMQRRSNAKNLTLEEAMLRKIHSSKNDFLSRKAEKVRFFSEATQRP
jgi:hypothetical protein